MRKGACDTVSPNTTPADPFVFLEEETELLRSTAAAQLTCTPVLGAVATEVLYPAVESRRFPAESLGSSLCPGRLVPGRVGAVRLTRGTNTPLWLEVSYLHREDAVQTRVWFLGPPLGSPATGLCGHGHAVTPSLRLRCKDERG